MNPLITERLRIRGVRAADGEALYDGRRRVAAWQGRSDRTLGETRAMYAEYADMATREPGAVPGWHQYVIEAGRAAADRRIERHLRPAAGRC